MRYVERSGSVCANTTFAYSFVNLNPASRYYSKKKYNAVFVRD